LFKQIVHFIRILVTDLVYCICYTLWRYYRLLTFSSFQIHSNKLSFLDLRTLYLKNIETSNCPLCQRNLMVRRIKLIILVIILLLLIKDILVIFLNEVNLIRKSQMSFNLIWVTPLGGWKDSVWSGKYIFFKNLSFLYTFQYT